MNNEDRIEIVKSFIAKHKLANIDDWILGAKDKLFPGSRLSREEEILRIYQAMSHGNYSGNCGADDDEYGEFTIEISQYETASGRTELFSWEDAEEYRLVRS